MAFYEVQARHALDNELVDEATAITPGFLEFKEFLTEIQDLREQKTDPQKRLRYCGRDDIDGTPLGFLVHGKWQAIFRIEESKHLCTAISINEIGLFAQAVHGMRRLLGKRLGP
jgi:hypothetical protein